jgi:omega-6 fatty acid desaturase (delta-12 desaturase)
MNYEINSASKTINETELFMKYKSSYTSAFIDFSVHTFLLSCSVYSLWYFRNSWLSVFIVPLLGFLNVKTFIIFHDCGHNSYTPSKTLNYIIGIITGVFVQTPFSWGFRHDTHHATNGNIENKYDWRFNEHIYYTLSQYKKLNIVKRSIIRFFITPEIFFMFAPLLNFFILERFSFIKLINRKIRKTPVKLFWLFEQIINNCGVLYLNYIIYKNSLLFFWIIVMWIGSNIGVVLFHCQHTYNPPYVVNNETWNMKDSGINGSSFIQIPFWLKYFTGGIEYHHIHHMNAKIPNYNLQKYHEEVVSKSNMFDNIVKLSMKDCYNNLLLVLYDEDKKRYITFAEADDEIRKDKNR